MMRKICSIIICLLVIQSAVGETKPIKDETRDLDSLPLEEIQNFAEIFTSIKQNYVEKVTDRELLNYAIQGMLNGLDPHSHYFFGEKHDRLKTDALGRFNGLGVEVTLDNGMLKIVSPIDDTPAAKEGLKAGDTIIRVDGKPVVGTNLNEAAKGLRGAVGTSVVLTIFREANTKPFTVKLKRAIIRTNSVRSTMLGGGVGYLRISQFQQPTAENFRSQLKTLTRDKSMKGLILDLRNNPGGLLTSAVAITDLFVEEGVIVSTRGRLKESEKKYLATNRAANFDKPIIILINKGTASAAEIVAVSLQEHQQALLLGTTSYGKGSVQTVVDIDSKQSIKFTTARYYTPLGNSIQDTGVKPDIEIQQKIIENKSDDDTKKKRGINKLMLKRDHQLQQAFNIMQGMMLVATQTR